MMLNNQWINRELKTYIDTMTMETQWSKHMGCNKSNYKKEVYSNVILPQETRKISNRQPNLTPKTTRERRTNKT